ncbi:MAG TPA: 16S rRNA (adenine(1518)-N(6)/adenine(1519)-N(6))-dimethyltransferase RsmA [Ignavibacteriaceae bacterium]|nr:16S rRNA (adenine(1518)-N(6)/adenine(1519)-N(6))-dimethyltransferase RsmA [Ignavibacteriaceae bacterium]
MDNLKPLKRFGQNYLKDPNIIGKIIKEIDPKSGDRLIEIGPGLGALTNALLQHTPDLTAVEIDKRAAAVLSKKFPALNIINRDFLTLDLNKLYPENFRQGMKKNRILRIAGNIPYNITSPVLFKLILNNDLIRDSVLMVQYEVAKRITAERGSKNYGILTILLNFFSETKLSFKVSPNVFFPKPKVFSAVIHLYFKDISMEENDKQLLINIVKAAFGNRRKTIKNSLSNSIFGDIDFSGSGIDLSLRAEQHGIGSFLKLAEFAKRKEVKNIVDGLL